MANPRLRDIEAENLVNCKIDDADLKLFQDCRKQIRITDEQDAVNRGRWYNLPKNIDSHLLERMLYYRGQVAIFYTEEDDKWRILPYVGCGGIDEWGRLKKLKPLPFTGSAKVDETKVFMPGLERKIIYDVKLDDLTAEDFLEGAVILHDYTPQLSQYCIPRKELNESLCELEARCLPMLRTALTNSTGISGMRVNSPDEAYAVEIASKNLDEASLAGRKWIGIVGHQDFQGFDGSTPAQAEVFMQAMQSIDNFRLGTYGLDNGGLFQKKAHMLQTEENMNGGGPGTGLILDDAIWNRQHFCDIANSIWGLSMFYEPAESATGQDMNADGVLGNDTMAEEGANDVQ